ncbi:DEAD/DEAH box helicase family protein [Streptomyces sp. ISL-98]|uniref:type I restriction endonuclease subunit R n=1 Tax=Streptomyces sp. ISL-98 TaxID=2819192 RepID=UPI0027E40129|nr:DEAD/DEAH box helicase family protein [Streptomyces sp. ISL-98]
MGQVRGETQARIKDLAASSANFGFLEPIEPLLVLFGAGAEANLYADPRAALSRATQFGEVLATELTRLAGVSLPGGEQAARLHLLTRAGVLDPRIRGLFENLRRLDGTSATEHDDIEHAAFQAVHTCFQLGVWFFRVRTGDREQIPFIPPQPPSAVGPTVLAAVERSRRALEQARLSFADRERDRAAAEETARRTAAIELRRATEIQPKLVSQASALDADLELLQSGFEARKPLKRTTATQREKLVSRARLAAQEPLSEVKVRERIDEMLNDAGWVVQDAKGQQDLFASRGVAVREVTTAAGRADYLLYVDRKLVGVVEAKQEGADLTAAQGQADRYAEGLTNTQTMRAWRTPLPYRYVSDGNRVLFRNTQDPDSRTRSIFGFPRPETVARWMREAEANREAPTYRARLRSGLPALDPAEVASGRLRPAQFDAVNGLEAALRRNSPRSLIQMATGAGKTYAAVTACYRLLKYAKAERILFLVDRNNLGNQALSEFSNYTTPDDGRKFTELYNVDQLTGTGMLASSKVVVSTIQRLSRILSGQENVDARDYTEPSAFESEEKGEDGDRPIGVSYNRRLPPESFDLIIIDECHRSIYGKWRSVLEYFDAHLLGLTATPVAQTFAFFGGEEGLVSEYTYEQAVADGVAVDYLTYRIRTEIAEQGSVIPVDTFVPIKNRRTRRTRYEELDDDFTYTGQQIGSKVISTDQLRVALSAFRDNLSVIFPDRVSRPNSSPMVPKTLIFAKDDNHADEVVEMTRTIFGRGDDFSKKITGKAKAPDRLLSEFRNTPELRIAVTVDMIATGTDVRAIECVFFLRDIRSWSYFEQMRGRGSRVIDSNELRAVTPDVEEKTRFIVVDAIGVTESHKRETRSITDERDVKRLALRKLLEKTAGDGVTEDEAEELALRLTRLSRKLTQDEQEEIARLAEGKSLDSIAGQIMRTVDVDRVVAMRGEAEAAGEDPDHAVYWAVQDAVAPLASNRELRSLLINIRTEQRIVYDEVSQDTLISAAHVENAPAVVNDWQQYIRDHRDEIAALQIALTGDTGRDITPREAYRQLKDLASRIARPPHQWTIARLWRAYEQLGKATAAPGAMHGPPDLVSIIRYELGLDGELRPYRSVVEDRFANFIARQSQAGVTFTPDELWWLERIVDTMAVSVRFDAEDLERVPFTERGGIDGFLRTFGDDRAVDLLERLDRELTA